MKPDSANLSAVAAETIARFRASGDLDISAVDAVVRAALSSDPEAAGTGTGAFFGGLVEPLCDSFDRAERDAYYRVMARAIALARALRHMGELDAALSAFGLDSEDALVERAIRNARGAARDHGCEARRIYLLSRVTLGADVAVTGVGVRRMINRFPGSEIVLVGGSKMTELFGGDDRLRFLPLDYPRKGTLADRFRQWSSARALLDAERFSEDDLLIDPDSRITQVGMLPLTAHEHRAHFFEGIPWSDGDERPLGLAFGHFLDERFGWVSTAAIEDPYVSLQDVHWQLAESIWKRCGLTGRKTVALSFGVGGNEAKRLGAEFEADLVARLLAAGVAVLLDHGAGEGERTNVETIVRTAKQTGRAVARFTQPSGAEPLSGSDATPDVITWDGGIGAFAALLAQCHGYAGYDSLFQHVAAALSVPVTIAFAGYGCELFARRWRPHGPGPISVFAIGPGDSLPADLAKQMASALLR